MLDFEKIRSYNYKESFALSRMFKLMEKLNQPQKSLKCIHIAGTKGKTSTAHYITRLLMISGEKRVGLYTSPHIESPTERIQLDGNPIALSDLESLMEEVKAVSEEFRLEVTYFEAVTAAAFLYFSRQKANWVILETGLGGRLDATNIIMPVISIITPIDKDHTHILGKNQLKIAYEKLGILKKGVPFILGPQKKSVQWLSRYFGWKKHSPYHKPLQIDVKKTDRSYQINFTGRMIEFSGPNYALSNFLTALNVMKVLGISTGKVHSFVHRVPGRFELYLNGKGAVILDGAHNPFSARALIASLKEKFPDTKFIFVLNTFPDKDYRAMIEIFAPLAKKFLIPEREDFATDAVCGELEKRLLPHRRIKLKDLELNHDESYCFTGSFHLLGGVRGILRKQGLI